MGFFSVPNTQPTSQEFAQRVRADLANNPQFAAWSKGSADIIADPHKFGIDYLPHGAWINKRGEVVTTDTGIPTAAKLLPAVGATLGTMTFPGLPLASGVTSGSAATSASALPATVPGSYASTLYASGGFGVPGATAEGLAAGTGGLGTIAANTARGAANGAGQGLGSRIGNGLVDTLTSGNGIAGLAGLLTTLATRPNNSGGSGNGIGDNAQLQRLLDMSAQRAERTDPLHQAITQLAMNRLPTNVQR